MKSFVILVAVFLFLVNFSALSEECQYDPNVLSAKYEMTHIDVNNKSKPAFVLTVVRNNKQVAHQQNNTGLTEVWNQLNNNRLSMIRYFIKDKRGIEYQPTEIQNKSTLDVKMQLLGNSFIDKMTLISSSGEGCDHEQHFSYKQTFGDKTSQYQLIWQPGIKAIKSLNVVNNNAGYITKETWQRIDLNIDKAFVLGFFSNLSDLNTTDYTDIGDMESDPFFAKMINQGFIEHSAGGFYNS